MLFWCILSCSEYTVGENKRPTEVTPPPVIYNPEGNAPDWDDCSSGFEGQYYNLPLIHEDVEPEGEVYPQENIERLDWWDEEYLAFRRYDSALDFGPQWYPVDEGFDGDPSYFTAQWTAWLRVPESTTIDFLIGASDDFWMFIEGVPVIVHAGISDYAPRVVSLELGNGQFPFTIFYAHRSGESALEFRLLGENAKICYPDFN